MKQIVSQSEIANDAGLRILKAFRIANKRCGETRKQFNDETTTPEARNQAAEEYTGWCNKLRALKQEAHNANFEIWVNPNGHTGHTYGKDYKLTSDVDNDIEAFNLARQGQRAAVQQTLDNAQLTGDEPEDLPPDENFSEGEE